MTVIPRTILLVLSLALLPSNPARAATPVEPGQLATGLRCAARDSLGLLWLGAVDGLYSWDGRHLLRQDSRDGWEAGGVSALEVDGLGVLWAAADSGLVRRDEVFRRVELHSPVALGRGRALRVQGDTLWLGTERGLLRWQERQGERVLLSGMSVTCLGRLPDGHLVCGTQDRGLFRFDQEGNPAAMRESYRALLPTVSGLQPVGDGSGDLLLLGRDEERRLGLARLFFVDGQLRRVPGEVPPASAGMDWKLLRDHRGLLLRAGAQWLRWTAVGLRPEPAPATHLALPMPEVLGELPQLAAMRPEGRLEVQSKASGLLVPRDAGVALAWESPADGGWRPVQVAEAAGASWVLLRDGPAGRVLRTTAQGNLAVDLARVDGAPTSLCATADGALLLGSTGGLYRLEEVKPVPLPGSGGAHWLVPFTGSSILVAGPLGLAVWEDGDLQRLRVSEPVHRAVPDGFGGVLAACDRHLLRLNELNELDSLSYPDQLTGPDGPADPPGRAVRQLLADAAGRVWLLDEQDLHLRAREGAPWTRPLAGEGISILSLALDASGRLWLSTRQGTGWLVPDRTPPVVVLLQDPRELEQADHRLVLRLGAADPLGQGPQPLVRLRLDDQAWGPWRPAGEIPLADLLPARGGGTFRLQAQALDAWGNLSRQTLVLPLVVPKDQGRLPFTKRLFLLLALVALAVLTTTFYPGRPGLLASVGLGLGVGAWVFLGTTEPHLWWALPIILGLSSKLTTDQVRSREKERRAPEPGILDVVDLLRDFGHSGSATRNLDRLLRGARNLYVDGQPDPDVLQVFRSARGVFLDLTVPTLEQLLAALRRLGPGERALPEEELSRLQETVAEAGRRLDELADPPPEEGLRALAFVLDRLERALGETQHRVDLCISSPPLKVLDRVLEDRAGDLAGVELDLRCEREVRQVLVRLPVDRLQFILDNLVDNALHWMAGRPLQRLSIEVRERPSTLQLRVTDTGPGLPADQHERIFEAGVSAKRAGSDRQGGYGLYRSREILARFGGRLVVERSVPGEGSTFLLEVKKVEPGRS